MKKNLLILMMTVLCAGFVSAQTVNTVRGFVPGGSTGTIAGDVNEQAYGAFGLPFGAIVQGAAGYELSASIAQMQLVPDTTIAVITYGEGYRNGRFNLSWDSIQTLLAAQATDCDAEGLHGFVQLQVPNVAEYNYDSLQVVKLYVCPENKLDNVSNDYLVIALNNVCWFKSNLRDNTAGRIYASDRYQVTDSLTFGLLYTWSEAAGAEPACNEDGFLQGICPDGWHLPSGEEMSLVRAIPATDLRADTLWNGLTNTNATGFSAMPAGLFNSTTQQFEGLFTETDFWTADNCEDGSHSVMQLAYFCDVPLTPNRLDDDRLSVRCVYDIIKAFDKCEDNGDNDDDDPDLNTCPGLTNVSAMTATRGIEFDITNYDPNLVTRVNVSFQIFDTDHPNGYYTSDPFNPQPQIGETSTTAHVAVPFQGNIGQDVTKVIAHVQIQFADGTQCGVDNVPYLENSDIIYEATTPQVTCPDVTNVAAMQTTRGIEFDITDYDARVVTEINVEFKIIETDPDGTYVNVRSVPQTSETSTTAHVAVAVPSDYNSSDVTRVIAYVQIRFAGGTQCGVDDVLNLDPVTIYGE